MTPLDYLARGWAIFPLHSPTAIDKCSCLDAKCTSVGKHPRTANGVKDASKDPAQIAAWWRRWPAANLAVATGDVSNLLVIDLDGPDGLHSWSELTRKFAPVQTLTAETGNGLHLYFRGVCQAMNRVSLADGVDVRASGGYVVAPPSVHRSGVVYGWANAEKVAPAPWWVAALVVPQRRGVFAPGGPRGHMAPEAFGPFGEGERNDGVFRAVSRWIWEGRDDVLALARRVPCSPPLPDKELATMVRNAVARYKRC